jgi:hypothetical protein
MYKNYRFNKAQNIQLETKSLFRRVLKKGTSQKRGNGGSGLKILRNKFHLFLFSSIERQWNKKRNFLKVNLSQQKIAPRIYTCKQESRHNELKNSFYR